MKILYVSQYFPPEMGAPSARTYEHARHWVSLGNQVTVITGFPNHPTGIIRPEYRGYWVKRENIDGIDVLTARIQPDGRAVQEHAEGPGCGWAQGPVELDDVRVCHRAQTADRGGSCNELMKLRNPNPARLWHGA